MNRREALEMDTGFIVDYDAAIGAWSVFGDVSCFCYYIGYTEEECNEWLRNFFDSRPQGD